MADPRLHRLAVLVEAYQRELRMPSPTFNTGPDPDDGATEPPDSYYELRDAVARAFLPVAAAAVQLGRLLEAAEHSHEMDRITAALCSEIEASKAAMAALEESPL